MNEPTPRPVPPRRLDEERLEQLLSLMELGPDDDPDRSLGAALVYVGRDLPATARAAHDLAEAAWDHLLDHIYNTPAQAPAIDYSNWMGARAEIQSAYALRVGLLVGYAAASQQEFASADVVQAAKTAAFHVDSDRGIAEWVGLR